MSSNLQKNLKLLQLLSNTRNSTTRKAILKDLCDKKMFFSALKEICKNTLAGNVKMSKYRKNKLRKYKKVIKGIGTTKVTSPKTRMLVKQSGGFLPILVPAVISILTQLLNGKL